MNVSKVATIVLKILMVVSVLMVLVHFHANVLKVGLVTVLLMVTDVSTMTNVILALTHVTITLSVVTLVDLLNANVVKDGLVTASPAPMLMNVPPLILIAVTLSPHVLTMTVLTTVNALMAMLSMNSQTSAMMSTNVLTTQVTAILPMTQHASIPKVPSHVFVPKDSEVLVPLTIHALPFWVNVTHSLLKGTLFKVTVQQKKIACAVQHVMEMHHHHTTWQLMAKPTLQ